VLNDLIGEFKRGSSLERCFQVIEESENDLNAAPQIAKYDDSNDSDWPLPQLPISGDQPFYIASAIALSFAVFASVAWQ